MFQLGADEVLVIICMLYHYYGIAAASIDRGHRQEMP